MSDSNFDLRRKACSRPHHRNQFRLGIQALENRIVLSSMPLVVTTLQDVVANDGEVSLREAIATANSTAGHNMIAFKSGLNGSILLSGSQLEITDDLTINGPQSGKGPNAGKIVLDGQGNLRVLAVLPPVPSGVAPEVAISDLTIANGLATDAPGYPAVSGFAWGGGLYNQGGEVELKRVRMLNNHASGPVAAGGAVANEFGGTLIVSQSHFENNLAFGIVAASGGAIASDRGPVGKSAHVEIDHSSFDANEARSIVGQSDVPVAFPYSGAGGGGALGNFASTMLVSHSDFSNNKVFAGGQAFGGAITSTGLDLFGVSPATLDVRHSSFVGNMATGHVGIGGNGAEAYGGAVNVLFESEATLSHNSFEDNMAVGGAATSATGKGGTGTGGAVSGLARANLSLEHNTFNDNQALGGVGGVSGLNGIGQGGAVGAEIWRVDGGIFDTLKPVVSMKNDRLDGNHADGVGGGIFNVGQMTIDNAVLSGNQAIGQAYTAFATGAVQLAGGATGGGIVNHGSLAVHGTRFTENVSRGADNINATEPVYAGAQFPGNAFGGGLSNFGQATINNSRFDGNVAEAGDGGIGGFATVGSGGAIYNDASMSVSGSRFTDNVALAGDNGMSLSHNGHALGGAITSGQLLPIFVPTAPGADLVIEKSQFSGNRAVGGNNNVVLDAVIPRADGPNNAFGGAILVYQGTASIQDTSIVNNRALGGDGGGAQNGSLGVGGGIFLFSFVGSVTAELGKLRVQGNEARGGNGGDGIGGGIAIGSLDSPYGAGGSTRIVDSIISHNRAVGGAGGGNGQGGGIYLDDADAFLIRDQIFANSANGELGQGGGIYIEDEGPLAGDLQMDWFTFSHTRLNDSSDDGDNIFGDFDVSL